METAHRICPLCEACCGLELGIEAGKVTEIRGYAPDVLSGGFICPKAAALRELHDDPDRVRTPLVKRDGTFIAVSWDDAFAEIERRLPPILAAHGRDAAALVIGNPTAQPELKFAFPSPEQGANDQTFRLIVLPEQPVARDTRFLPLQVMRYPKGIIVKIAIA